MKTLIISDIHHGVNRADCIIDEAKADRTIFLGDFFDMFDDTPADAARTAQWIRARIENHPEDVFLMGNHDVPYRWVMVPEFCCPGWTNAKWRATESILTPKHWNQFKLHHWEPGPTPDSNPWLFSHAGICEWIFRPGYSTDNYIDKNPPWTIPRSRIDELCATAIEHARSRIPELVLSAVGHACGGQCQKGGIVWQRWYEFDPTPGINQIVGHTPSRRVQHRTRMLEERMLEDKIFVQQEDANGEFVSDNYCLDTVLNHYGILENGEVSFYNAPLPPTLIKINK